MQRLGFRPKSPEQLEAEDKEFQRVREQAKKEREVKERAKAEAKKQLENWKRKLREKYPDDEINQWYRRQDIETLQNIEMDALSSQRSIDPDFLRQWLYRYNSELQARLPKPDVNPLYAREKSIRSRSFGVIKEEDSQRLKELYVLGKV
jgi:hypothetical protein